MKMKKYMIFVIGILFQANLFAQPLDAYYSVSFGVVGEVAKASAHLQKEGDRYTIEVAGEAAGIAKALSKNRKERQRSEGRIVDGILVSDRYSIERSFGDKIIRRVYEFDHAKGEVWQNNEKFEGGKLIWQEKKVLDFYAPNDLLTLYFNLDTLVPQKEQAAHLTFKAVGAEKQQGSVEVIIPSIQERKRFQEELGDAAGWYLSAIIHQKIFASSEGELHLLIGADGITQRAVLKDVLLFGDIVAKRVK